MAWIVRRPDFLPMPLILLVILAEDREQLADPRALGPDIRRRLRAKAVLNQARKQNQDDSLEAHPRNATFDRMINR